MRYEKILKNIWQKSRMIGENLRFMELCGTHSETVAKNGIKKSLPKNIELVSGPGCPICVTDQNEIDIIVGLALSGIPVAAYGDALSVSGNSGSLEEARRKGAKVFAVYDIAEAIEIKKKEPELIFWGIGFETTVPATAWAIRNNLTVFSSHKIFVPAMDALLKNKNINIDGFINPGHVSAVTGTKIYEKFNFPQVVAGFEASDVLQAVDMLLDQIMRKEKKVENEYVRLVKREGNKKAIALINSVFEISNTRWRGLGEIKNSGLKIRKKYQNQDATFIYKDIISEIKKNTKTKFNACRCGEVLRGIIEARGCPLFKKVCSPDNPQGACMVSTEGACNIEFRYAK